MQNINSVGDQPQAMLAADITIEGV